MYIQLLGADASAKNLGQITIAELDSDVLNIMREWTRYSIYSPQSCYLNEFVTTLKSAGLWSKVYLLWLPWMANDVEELLYNPQGLTLSTQKTDQSSTLYAENGIIKFVGKAAADGYPSGAISIKIPSIDVKGKFITMGNLAQNGFLTIAMADNKSSMFVTGSNKMMFAPGYNWNKGFGNSRTSSTDRRSGTMIIASDLTQIDNSSLSKLRVINGSGNWVDSVKIGVLDDASSYSMTVDNLLIGQGSSGTISQPISLTDNRCNSFIIGNTSITESEGLIIDNAMDKFMKSIASIV